MDRFAKGVLLVLLVGAGAVARAEPVTYKLDPTHTWTTWEVRHFGTSTYRGRFDRKEGTVTIDRAAKTGRVELMIDLTSVDTGVAAGTGSSALEEAIAGRERACGGLEHRSRAAAPRRRCSVGRPGERRVSARAAQG